MTHYYIVITRAGVSLSDALTTIPRAGVEVKESRARCVTFTSKLDGLEYRRIGSMTFPADEMPLLWTRAGCTSGDLAALLRFGATYARRKPSTFPSKIVARLGNPPALGVRLVRPLSDYGDDLHLVVAIPDTIPATLEGVRA